MDKYAYEELGITDMNLLPQDKWEELWGRAKAELRKDLT
jgi:hypothetical protein